MKPMPTTRTIDGFRSEIAGINGIRLHYRIGGDPNGRPVMLWHGFLSTSYTWRKVAPALAAAGMAVLVPDMRGYGDSDKPPGDEGYDARALAEEGRALVAQLRFGGKQPLLHAAFDMGASAALLYAADHPKEVAGLVYIEAPAMIGDVLRTAMAYTPDVVASRSLWWWILPLVPGVPEHMIVGNERAFLTWFYEMATAKPEAIETDTIEEYLRSFAGREGVLGSLGIYRAAFKSIAQTEPLMSDKVKVPIIAIGGDKGFGRKVGDMVGLVADSVTAYTLADCGHFMPEECPDAVIKRILALAAATANRKTA